MLYVYNACTCVSVAAAYKSYIDNTSVLYTFIYENNIKCNATCCTCTLWHAHMHKLRALTLMELQSNGLLNVRP